MQGLRIYPLHVGTITRFTGRFCHGVEPDQRADFPLICWYIEGSNKRILVDTGGTDPAEANPRWLPYKREQDQTVENALKKVGVRCEDIDLVIVTHLHWDHCAGNGLFPKAKMIVQEEELRSARSPFPVFMDGYIKSMVEGINYTVIAGDQEITEGVKVLLTPGHTYGLQGVLVECERRRIFIAGDTFPLFRNFEQPPPAISSIYVDLQLYYATIERIEKLSAFVLPGHDFRVFERDVYE